MTGAAELYGSSGFSVMVQQRRTVFKATPLGERLTA